MVIAKAHHGSVSKEQRGLIEDDLKRGRLPAVVATSSLELGIDMGAVDLVVQIESPPSVASALQRVGRAGHQVGEVSRGVLFPKHRGDLAQTAVAVQRMRRVRSSRCGSPPTPWTCWPSRWSPPPRWTPGQVDDLYALARRSASFAGLPRSAYDATLDLLSGRYPSDEFAELRPRIVWDRVTGVLTARPGAQRLAVTSGGTIPDRGLFGVFLVGGEGPGRRVGRAGRGDGLRVPRRRHLRPRRHQLADRGHHPRPGAGHPGARASPAGCRSGRATRWAGPPSWARPSAATPASSPRCPRTAPRRGPARTGSTTGPPATWWPTCTSSSTPRSSCPATGRCWSSASATSSATGGSWSTPPTAPRCTPPGRWPSTPGFANGSGSTARPSPPTTAS